MDCLVCREDDHGATSGVTGRAAVVCDCVVAVSLRSRLAETLAEYCGAGYEALDAVLAVLSESADEWFEAWIEWQDEDGDPKFVGLLAVLQGEPE
jgi:hypothetical protein